MGILSIPNSLFSIGEWPCSSKLTRMQLIKKYGITMFLLVLAFHCACIYLGYEVLRTASKLFLMPLLATWFWANTTNRSSPYHLLIFAGLLFSFLGDLILTRSGETFFLLGMLAFVGTHICNSIYFYKLRSIHVNRMQEAGLAAIILFIITIVVFTLLKPYLSNFTIPILIYMAIISMMAILATNTLSNPSLKKMALAFFIPGAALFVLSDGMLAMNKFLLHQPLLDIVVMLTYGGAQCLLILGFSETGNK